MPTDIERIAKLEKEVEDLHEMVRNLINQFNRVPKDILLGPTNPVPGPRTNYVPPLRVK